MKHLVLLRICLIFGLFATSGCGQDDATTAAPAADTSAGDATDAGIDNDTQAAADTAIDTTTNGQLPPAPACQDGTKWTSGTKAFEEATKEWGLEGITGIRLSVLDYNNDGFADVLIRQGDGPDDFSANGTRKRFLLKNTGSGFVDVTQESGIFTSRKSAAQGGLRGAVLAIGDVDNDGDEDVFIARAVHHPQNPDYDGETSELVYNDGKGKFSLGPKAGDAQMEAKPTVPAGVSFVDYDRDGNLDLWIPHNMRSGQNSPLQDRLYKGDGKGGFIDVTVASGLTTKLWQSLADLDAAKGHSWPWSSAACDLNNDGVPELLASSYGRAPNHLWRAVDGKDGVSFVNESVASGYAYDHRQDWRTNINAQCYCMDNPKAAECDTCPKPKNPAFCAQLKAAFKGKYRWQHAYDRRKFRLGGNSGATVCADVDNDGWIDLLTGEIVHPDVGETSDPTELMFNEKHANVRFSRPGPQATGLVREHKGDTGDMANAVFDFDNDGWPDVYIGSSDYPGTKGLLFHQASPRNFKPVPFADFFDHNRSAGVVAADFDRDGDLDLLVGHSRMRCGGTLGKDCYPTTQVRFFRNVLGKKSNWLQLKLVGGDGVNRSAIGARVTLEAGGVVQTQDVDGGHGHFNTQRDKVLHFGLGKACEAKITVRWPDGKLTQQTFTAAANRRYVVQKGAPLAVAP